MPGEVGEVLERLVRRMERYMRGSGLLRILEDEAEADGEGDPTTSRCARRSTGSRGTRRRGQALSIPAGREEALRYVAALSGGLGAAGGSGPIAWCASR
jgi:hypothetical protein